MITIERLKMIWGFVLLLMLCILAGIFAVHKVEAQTSFGLMPVVTSLATLAGAFANWAFGESRQPKPPAQPPTP